MNKCLRMKLKKVAAVCQIEIGAKLFKNGVLLLNIFWAQNGQCVLFLKFQNFPSNKMKLISDIKYYMLFFCIRIDWVGFDFGRSTARRKHCLILKLQDICKLDFVRNLYSSSYTFCISFIFHIIIYYKRPFFLFQLNKF